MGQQRSITVTISEKAAQYLAEVQYSLVDKDEKPATLSECISEILEVSADFEKCKDDQIVNYLETEHQWYSTKKNKTEFPDQKSWHDKIK